MKKQIFKWVSLAGALILAQPTINAQNWFLGGNNINATPLNNLGTTNASVVKPVNFITNGVLRATMDGNNFITSFAGSGINNTLNLNTNGTNNGVVTAGRNLGLFAGSFNCNTSAPANDVYIGGRNIFMQPTDATPNSFLTDDVQRVLIGIPTTFVPTVATPKLLIRGGGSVSSNNPCIGNDFLNPDNIGLVSLGNFGESPTSNNANKWISLGSRPPSTNQEFNSYGYRAQWNKYAVDLTVQDQAASSVSNGEKDASLTWQDGSTTTAPNTVGFNTTNSLLIQFRNGAVPTANSALARRTVARFSIVNGNGRLDVSGSINANQILLASDAQFKKDITQLKNSMDIINRLNPVTYNFQRDEFPSFGFSNSLQYGFIAQELEKVLPTHVEEIANGYKAVNYVMLIPILTKALQESDKELKQTKANQLALEQKVNKLLEDNKNMADQLERKGLLTNSNSANDVQFFQNKPNPFNDVTSIGFNFKNDVMYKLVVTDLSGKLVKQFVNLQGSGEVKLTKDDFSASGIYLYSLITSNGDVIGSKQLVFEK